MKFYIYLIIFAIWLIVSLILFRKSLTKPRIIKALIVIVYSALLGLVEGLNAFEGLLGIMIQLVIIVFMIITLIIYNKKCNSK